MMTDDFEHFARHMRGMETIHRHMMCAIWREERRRRIARIFMVLSLLPYAVLVFTGPELWKMAALLFFGGMAIGSLIGKWVADRRDGRNAVRNLHAEMAELGFTEDE